jgi:hypothetical protein
MRRSCCCYISAMAGVELHGKSEGRVEMSVAACVVVHKARCSSNAGGRDLPL